MIEDQRGDFKVNVRPHEEQGKWKNRDVHTDQASRVYYSIF